MRICTLCILVVSILTSISYAGTIDPDTNDNKYLEYGQKYECVVGLCGEYENDVHYCASAVIIRPRWVLTAAHVVNKSKRCIVRLNNKQSKISKIICYKNFEENNFGYHDIAICYSEEELNISNYPELYEKSDENGKKCSIVGLGLHGDFITGCVKSDNKKRGGTNIIDNIEKDLLICTPSRKDSTHTDLEFLIGSGDSGGGLFIDGRLAGINSCVMASDGKPNSTYGDESGHTRVSKYIDWIKEIIIKNE